MRRLRRSEESGFTLPELLITMVILGVITFGLALAVITAFQNDQKTSKKVVSSHDAQLVSMYLTSDLQSTTSNVVFSPTANTECSGFQNLLRLRWSEQPTSPGASVTYTAAYRIVNASGEWRLVRYYCDSSVGGGTPTTLVVAHDLLANCAAPACEVSTSGATVTMKLTGSTGFTWTINGTRRTP